MRMMNPGIGIFVASLTSALVLMLASARAESWPQRAVRVIVPFGAGSGPDFAARLFTDRLSLRWKQPVIVENRPGADGLIGTAAFVNLRDDHVLMFLSAAPLSVLPVLQARMPYDPTRDVVPISSAADTFGAVAASASLKVESLADLVNVALSRPGQLNYHAFAGAFPILFAGFARAPASRWLTFPTEKQMPRFSTWPKVAFKSCWVPCRRCCRR
jgi:tripartite-type tricarboxylate transporter receptor subunit TctC